MVARSAGEKHRGKGAIKRSGHKVSPPGPVAKRSEGGDRRTRVPGAQELYKIVFRISRGKTLHARGNKTKLSQVNAVAFKALQHPDRFHARRRTLLLNSQRQGFENAG